MVPLITPNNEAFGDDNRAEAFGDLFKREQRRGHDLLLPRLRGRW